MSDIDIELIKQEILSLLVSSKDGLTERELLQDYRLFNSNKELPYRELGYPSLLALLRSWSSICRIQQQGNSSIKIFAVEEENTKHILSMVKGQRQTKSRRYGKSGRNRGRGAEINRNSSRGARFSQSYLNSNSNRSRGNNRGTSYNRMNFANNRFERTAVSTRTTMESSNQNYKNKLNAAGPSRFEKQQYQQQNRSYPTGSNRSQMSSYEYCQNVNSNLSDDRRITNNSTSLQITITNNTNTNHIDIIDENYSDYEPYSDTQFQISDYAFSQNPEQYYEDDEDKETEVINNLQMLLTQFSHGIRLLALDDLYQSKFGKSLLAELKISNILLIQDFVDNFAIISRHGEENGSCDHIITLRDSKQVAQTQSELLQQITKSGTVSKEFKYANNLFSYINDSRFQGFVSDIDKNEHYFHVQPVRYQEHITTLMEELHSYYSSPVSNSLIIHDIKAGLACATTYDDVYHRAFIKESDSYKCVIVYVDYGTIKEVNKEEQQFKYLVNHFAELPCMAIACRLYNIRFIPDDNRWLSKTYNEVYALCKDGPFFIEPVNYMNGLLTVRILDADEKSLNDILVQLKLAVNIFTLQSRPSIDTYEQSIHASKPVELESDCLHNAAECPLPDSDPSTPLTNTIDSQHKLQESRSLEIPINSSNSKHEFKSIQINEHNSFDLIRHDNNKPYITCFNLARLLNISELDILSETLLSRTRLQQIPENRAIFDFLQQTNPIDCLHMRQNFVFLFDLTSTVQFIERVHPKTNHILVEVLRQQINLSTESQYWNTTHDCYKPSTMVQSILPTPSSKQNDVERYNELLNRRNILCNMFRTEHVTECTVELTSIEHELEQLVQKMRLGATSQQNCTNTSTPTSFTSSSNTDQQNFFVNKNDKLKDLMERCKTLINTILVLDDFVTIDDNITQYIENNLSFVYSGKKSSNDNQLYKQYSELLENLTIIVNNLQQKLPDSVHV